jgi:putative methyltransferase (TIGR04325 family)
MLRERLASLRRRMRPTRAPAIWSGVYPTFEAMPHAGSPFRTADALIAAERLLRETEAAPMPREAAVDHEVLALVVRLIGTPAVSVVDFGGGVGQSFAALRRMVARDIRLRYRVVELEDVAARGREIWSGNSEIEFASTFGDAAPSIVFSKGSIQYFRDWPSLLGELLGTGARFVLLEKLPLVTAPTYATMQVDVYGQSLPYWMFNVGDLERVAREAGYAIALQRRLERVYDQSEFAPELRMERATSLLFERGA